MSITSAPRLLRRLLAAVAATLLVSGCHFGPEPHSYTVDPLGWPAKGLSALGFEAADSEIAFARESGRFVGALGETLDAPALLVEGCFTADGERLVASGAKTVRGLGSALTALINWPFFWVTGGAVDIGDDAELVNDALDHIERIEPGAWRYHPEDRRTEIFPTGTRVRASGRNLVWTVPGQGEFVQAVEVSPLLAAALDLSGYPHVAQARTWGFVVGSHEEWEACGPELRATVLLHEFWHQHFQIRGQFASWSVAFWPAYVVDSLGGEWQHHWAEVDGANAAFVIHRALEGWRPFTSGKEAVAVRDEAWQASATAELGASEAERRDEAAPAGEGSEP